MTLIDMLRFAWATAEPLDAAVLVWFAFCCLLVLFSGIYGWALHAIRGASDDEPRAWPSERGLLR